MVCVFEGVPLLIKAGNHRAMSSSSAHGTAESVAATNSNPLKYFYVLLCVLFWFVVHLSERQSTYLGVVVRSNDYASACVQDASS